MCIPFFNVLATPLLYEPDKRRVFHEMILNKQQNNKTNINVLFVFSGEESLLCSGIQWCESSATVEQC